MASATIAVCDRSNPALGAVDERPELRHHLERGGTEMARCDPRARGISTEMPLDDAHREGVDKIAIAFDEGSFHERRESAHPIERLRVTGRELVERLDVARDEGTAHEAEREELVSKTGPRYLASGTWKDRIGAVNELCSVHRSLPRRRPPSPRPLLGGPPASVATLLRRADLAVDGGGHLGEGADPMGKPEREAVLGIP